MKTVFDTSKIVLVTAVLGMAVAGCNRNESEQATGGADTSMTSPATTASNAGSAGSAASPGTSGAPGTAGSGASSSTDTSGSASTGSSGSSGSSSSIGAAIDDSVITTKVKTALMANGDIKGTDISVETMDGEVKLSGFASSPRQVEQAVKLAQAVKGVKKVDNSITVKK